MAVNVKFGADTSGLESGVARAKGALADFTAPIDVLGGAFDGLKDRAMAAIEGIGAGLEEAARAATSAIAKSSGALSGGGISLTALLGGGGAAAAGVGAIIGAVDEADQKMLTLQRDAEKTGLTLQQFQQYQYAASLGGVDDKAFASSLESAAQKLQDMAHNTTDLSKFLDANNVKYTQTNGQLISMDQYLQDAAALMARAKTEGDAIDLAKLLGLSSDWVAILRGGPVALRQAMEQATATGHVFDDQLVKKGAAFAQQWTAAQNEWANGFKKTLVELTPYVEAFISIVGKTLGGMVTAVETAYDHYETKSSQAGPTGTATISASTGDLGSAALTAFAPAIESGSNALGPFDRLLQETGLQGYTTANAVNALGKAFTAVGAAAQSSGPGLKWPGAGDADAARAAIAAMQGTIAASNLQYTTETKNLGALVALHQISESQVTMITLDAINQRQAAQEAAVQTTMAALTGNDAATSAEKQRLENELTKIVQQGMEARLALTEKETQQYQQQWQSVLGVVEGAFNSQLRGLLSGSETWAMAMKKITGDLIMDMIEQLEKFAVQKAALGLTSLVGGGPGSLLGSMGLGSVSNFFGLGGGTAGNAANTTALLTLTASVNALNVTLGGHAATVTANTVSTTVNTTATGTSSVATTTGATAATAQTASTSANTAAQATGLGAWIANTAATIGNTVATDAAAIGKFFGFAQGAWSIPHDMPAIVHKDEMIVPAQGGYADVMRNMLSGNTKVGANPMAALGAMSPRIFAFDVGTDAILRGGLAIVHPGETIIPPAARGSGPYTGAGIGAGVTRADVHGLLADHREQMGQMMATHRQAMSGLEGQLYSLRRRLR